MLLMLLLMLFMNILLVGWASVLNGLLVQALRFVYLFVRFYLPCSLLVCLMASESVYFYRCVSTSRRGQNFPDKTSWQKLLNRHSV